MTQGGAHWHDHLVVGGTRNGEMIKVEPGSWVVHVPSTGHDEKQGTDRYIAFIEVAQTGEIRHWLVHETIKIDQFSSSEHSAIRSLIWDGKIKWGA